VSEYSDESVLVLGEDTKRVAVEASSPETRVERAITLDSPVFAPEEQNVYSFDVGNDWRSVGVECKTHSTCRSSWSELLSFGHGL
jgi:hypothetical protein